jgi:hypothetical protein
VTDEQFLERPATAGTSLLREPALPILLMAWVAMLRREYVPDIVLFGGAAGLIVIDARRWNGRTSSAEPSSRARHPVLVLGATGLTALVMAGLPRSGWLDAAFGAVGVVVLIIGWLPGREERPSRGQDVDEPARWWVWPMLGLTLGLAALWSFLHRVSPMVDSLAHPSISSLVEPGLAHSPVRLFALWLWLLAGWWLLRRIQAWAA